MWWVLIEDSVAMGFMRFTANGVPFLGCRGWIWVVGVLRKKISVGYGGWFEELWVFR